jgi:hypothetical protein
VSDAELTKREALLSDPVWRKFTAALTSPGGAAESRAGGHDEYIANGRRDECGPRQTWIEGHQLTERCPGQVRTPDGLPKIR